MREKECSRCGLTKALSSFYPHPRTADGRLGKCKECCKAEARAHRAANLAACQAYDRARANLPHRVQARLDYQKTPRGIRRSTAAKVAWLQRNKDRRAAHVLLGSAIKSGTVSKLPCAVCGSQKRVHGHHDDYTKPLDVRWLCPKHHAEHHRKMRGH